MELSTPLEKTNSDLRRIANLSDSAGYFVYTVNSDGRKTMTEDSHIPCFALSKIRNLPWRRPSKLGAEYLLVRRGLIRILGGHSFGFRALEGPFLSTLAQMHFGGVPPHWCGAAFFRTWFLKMFHAPLNCVMMEGRLTLWPGTRDRFSTCETPSEQLLLYCSYLPISK